MITEWHHDNMEKMTDKIQQSQPYSKDNSAKKKKEKKNLHGIVQKLELWTWALNTLNTIEKLLLRKWPIVSEYAIVIN